MVTDDPHQWPAELRDKLRLELEVCPGVEPVSALDMVEQLEKAARMIEDAPYRPTVHYRPPVTNSSGDDPGSGTSDRRRDARRDWGGVPVVGDRMADRVEEVPMTERTDP